MIRFYLIIIISLAAALNLMGQSFQKPGGGIIYSKPIEVKLSEDDGMSGKLDPFLKMTINKISTLKSAGKYSDKISADLNKNITVNEQVLSETSVPVFIKTNSVDVTSAKINIMNGLIYTAVQDIITAELPVSSVKDLTSSSEIIYIQGSYVRQSLIDISRVQTKVDKIHTGTAIPRPYKGKDVVVGVVDSGIDWEHEDFRNAGGNRIMYLWDMSAQGTPPAGYNYGTEYTKAQLDANQCTAVDGDDGGGHGTHVAGTAAGSGAANSQYIGMAPESDIVFVKGFRTGPGFADVDVVNGCNYIFQKADQLQKPAVINLSLGGQFGPHDGSSLYEQSLSNLTGAGKIIVAAGGNSGGENIHLGYTVTASSINEAHETIWLIPDNTSASYIDLWYNTGNISIGIAAYDKTTLQLIGFTNPVAPGQQVQDQPFTVSGFTYGWFTIDATNTNDPNNNAKEVFIALDSHNGQANLGNIFWSLYTFGSGTLDAWNLGGEFDTYNAGNFKPGDNIKTIGSPGTAGKVICIGSYVTKTSWIDINGTTQSQPGNPVNGAISSFSSLGPSRDNRIKPDIVAPGEVIIAALSGDCTQIPPSSILSGGKLQKLQGTSMAAPHVTGTIALLLEKNPALDYDQTVNVLINTSVKDNFTGNSPGNIYGHGKLDAYNAFLNVSGGGGGQTTILQETFDNSFLPSGWQSIVTNSDFTWKQGNVENQNFNQIDPSSLFSAICPWVNENQDEWIITPPFSLGNGNASVEFYAGYSTDWLTSATMHLKISTDGGSSWINLWTAENDGQGWKWRLKTVNLTPYSNRSNLKLAWQYAGNDGDVVAIDAVKLIGFNITSVEEEKLLPDEFALHQNYPNPFNPSTKISFELPMHSKVTLKIFDVLGNEIAVLLNEEKKSGIYEIPFNASGLSSGIYFYSIQASSFNMVRKMILLK